MKFTVFPYPGRPKPWGVRYWLDRDTPVKKFFETEAQANERRAKLEAAFAAGGIEAVKRIDQDKDLAEAMRLAEEAGEPILAIVRRGLSVSKKNKGGATPLQDGYAGFMKRCDEIHLRTSTVEFYNVELERFVTWFGPEQMVGEIERPKLSEFLSTRPVKSRPHALRALRAWFRWMVRQEPPILQTDPSAGMGLERSKAGWTVEYLSVAESEALLVNSCEAIRPAVALMLFGGIRMEELYRDNAAKGEDVLHWEDIAKRAITVRAEVAKTRRGRTVRNAPANLWTWLPKDKAGPVCNARLRERLEEARAAAGLSKWAKSILRHTCGSHHAAAYEDLSATALLLRHEGDVRILNRHYREGVHLTKRDGKAFFALKPAA